MDPVWATLAEFWWIGPSVIGAGALGWFGVRHQRAENARRVAYDAARHELREARTRVSTTRTAVRVARAELARAQAERATAQSTPADVAAARHELQAAQRDAKAAAAAVRARRAQVGAARAALPAGSDPAQLPVAKLMATHDAVTARWMEYETDPAKLIAFPAMSDGRVPATAAYLAERATARSLRPESPRSRITVAAFTAYRDAVTRLVRTFDEAEREAWRQARAAGTVPPGAQEPAAQAPAAARWSEVAQSMLQRSAEAIERGTEALVHGTEAIVRVAESAGVKPPASTRARKPQPPASTPPDVDDAPDLADPQPKPASPVWPIPSRTSRPPGT